MGNLLSFEDLCKIILQYKCITQEALSKMTKIDKTRLNKCIHKKYEQKFTIEELNKILKTLYLPNDIFSIYKSMSEYEVNKYLEFHDKRVYCFCSVDTSIKNSLVGKWYNYGFSSNIGLTKSPLYEYEIEIDMNMEVTYYLADSSFNKGKIFIDENKYIYLILYLDKNYTSYELIVFNFTNPNNLLFISSFRANTYNTNTDDDLMSGFSITSRRKLNDNQVNSLLIGNNSRVILRDLNPTMNKNIYTLTKNLNNTKTLNLESNEDIDEFDKLLHKIEKVFHAFYDNTLNSLKIKQYFRNDIKNITKKSDSNKEEIHSIVHDLIHNSDYHIYQEFHDLSKFELKIIEFSSCSDEYFVLKLHDNIKEILFSHKLYRNIRNSIDEIKSSRKLNIKQQYNLYIFIKESNILKESLYDYIVLEDNAFLELLSEVDHTELISHYNSL